MSILGLYLLKVFFVQIAIDSGGQNYAIFTSKKLYSIVHGLFYVYFYDKIAGLSHATLSIKALTEMDVISGHLGQSLFLNAVPEFSVGSLRNIGLRV